jgi:hypothetical protein
MVKSLGKILAGMKISMNDQFPKEIAQTQNVVSNFQGK